MDLAFYQVEPTSQLDIHPVSIEAAKQKQVANLNLAQSLLLLCPLHKPRVRVPVAVQLPEVISHRLWCDGGGPVWVTYCPLDLQQPCRRVQSLNVI
jgi:hypothetical protein